MFGLYPGGASDILIFEMNSIVYYDMCTASTLSNLYCEADFGLMHCHQIYFKSILN